MTMRILLATFLALPSLQLAAEAFLSPLAPKSRVHQYTFDLNQAAFDNFDDLY